MYKDMLSIMLPQKSTKYLFFGGKGGVGKTTMATATAVWFADHGYKTTIVSTDPTVSLSAVFKQEIGGQVKVPINHVKNLCGLNINPADSKGVFLTRLTGVMSQMSETFGSDTVSTPCMEEMATFDQFVSFLEEPDGDVVVFDTAPTGKSLRELAMPFDWAGFLQKQITEGKKLAELLNTGENSISFEDLEKDKKRYDRALEVLRDRLDTVFTLVLLPERLPIEETQSAITGLEKLGIPVQGIVVNQTILPEVIEGNRFLQARANLQHTYLEEIDTRFNNLIQSQLPLLDHDVSDLDSLRKVGQLLYGKGIIKNNK
jgi:arsenite-transporting ATPase